MRQVIKILLTFLLIVFSLPSNASIEGKIEYKIPIDYSKLNQTELEDKAEFYYNLAIKTFDEKRKIINKEMTMALNYYTILNNKCPENQFFAIRLGNLYDLIGKNRAAKGCFYEAIGIDNTQPAPYFYFGEYYYRRELYRKALKFYQRAFKSGYDRHYETAYKMGDIYEKFGDTEAALRYLRLASELSPNTELDNKILRVENAHKENHEFYSNTRIHLIDR